MTAKTVLSNSVKFNRLTFIKKVAPKKALFLCDCGNETIKYYNNVVRGATTSCGCFKKEQLSENKPAKRHGLAKTPIYDVWHLMMRRCYEVGSKNYHQYGGRGIKVCKAWHDVETFNKWCTENGWKKGLQLDRQNNAGNYTPKNCKFVTSKANNSNRRDNYMITYKGETKTISEWARLTGIQRKTIEYRIRKFGWSVEDALSTKTKSNVA